MQTISTKQLDVDDVKDLTNLKTSEKLENESPDTKDKSLKEIKFKMANVAAFAVIKSYYTDENFVLLPKCTLH